MTKSSGPRRIDKELKALSGDARGLCLWALDWFRSQPEIVAARPDIAAALLKILGDHPEIDPDLAPDERSPDGDRAWDVHAEPGALGLAAAALTPVAHRPEVQIALRRAAANPTYYELYLTAASALRDVADVPENWQAILAALRRGHVALSSGDPGPVAGDQTRESVLGYRGEPRRQRLVNLHAALLSTLSLYAGRPEARDMLLEMLKQSPQDPYGYWWPRVAGILARHAEDPAVQVALVPHLGAHSSYATEPIEQALSSTDLTDATIAALIAALPGVNPYAHPRYVRVLARYAERPDVHAALSAIQSDSVAPGRNAARAALDRRGEQAIRNLQALRRHLELLFASEVDPDTAARLAEQCQALALWITDATAQMIGDAAQVLDNQALGERVRARRAVLGLSQVELAKKAGISQSYASRVEHGQVSISVDTLRRLAAALETSPAELLEETQAPSEHEPASGPAPAEV